MSQPARNIFVAIELYRPERGDDRIRETIESFGCAWARIHRHTFYLHGNLDAQFVGTKIWAVMTADDRLVVVDTTTNDARWFNVKPEVADFMVANWHA